MLAFKAWFAAAVMACISALLFVALPITGADTLLKINYTVFEEKKKVVD